MVKARSEKRMRLDGGSHDHALRRDTPAERLAELAFARDIDAEPQPVCLVDQRQRLVGLPCKEDLQPHTQSVCRCGELGRVSNHQAGMDEIQRRAVIVEPSGQNCRPAHAAHPGFEATGQRGDHAYTRDARARAARCRAQPSGCRCNVRLSVSLPITQSSVGRPITARPGAMVASAPITTPRRPSATRACPSRTSWPSGAPRTPGPGNTASISRSMTRRLPPGPPRSHLLPESAPTAWLR